MDFPIRRSFLRSPFLSLPIKNPDFCASDLCLTLLFWNQAIFSLWYLGGANKIVEVSSESVQNRALHYWPRSQPVGETSGQTFLTYRGEWAPIMVSLIDFVLGWLNEWETRELDRMFANHSPSPKGDRRVDFEKRRSVSEMSPEELLRELLTSEVKL
jgi:hypothetical protein